MKNLRGAAAIVLVAGWTIGQQAKAEPAAAPDFGPNVLLFDPSTPDIQTRLDAIFAQQARAQFGPNRYALLFKPGQYKLDVQIGYYMHLAGLGQRPDDVQIDGAVRSNSRRHALTNFWRAVENVAITPSRDNGVCVWAVSQAATMRRTRIKGDLHLFDQGYSSGGFLADSVVDGQVSSGSQQQWLSRNVEWGRGWNGGNWNMVFVGVLDPPAGQWPAAPYTIVDKTPIIREKPFLFVDDAGDFFVAVPRLRKDSQGANHGSLPIDEPTQGAIPIDQCYIARADRDTAATINAALAEGKHLILTPGIYRLDEPLRVTKPDTVVLGLGLATLVPEKGHAAMEVADVDGVKLAGLLFDAAPTKSDCLLQVGPPGSSASHAANPIFLYDIFCRAGGPGPGAVDTMVVINSSNVVGDCLWLWRGDHGDGVGWTTNPTAHGIVVNGDDVTIYGLFVEHTQAHQTLWNGNGGRVYLYQSEMPYDPPSVDDWKSSNWKNGDAVGFASYKVADSVTTHEAWGVGVYSFFRYAPCVPENGIETPHAPGVKLHHMLSFKLGGGHPDSGIRHVINGLGDAVMTTGKATVDEFPP